MKKRKNKLDTGMLILRIILLLVVSGGGLFAIRSVGTASEPQIGPYTEIQLPLEDLPALPEGHIYNPVVELTSGEQSYPPKYLPGGEQLKDGYSLDTLATAVAYSEEYNFDYDPNQLDPLLQVLYVLEDPREVPLARYAYNSEAGVVLPADDMEQLAGQNLKTINVYVKVQNFSSQPLADPLFASEFADSDWPALYVNPLNIELEGISQFPCAPVEYADGTEPYALPAGIDGGGGVGEDGLYNPAAYAPPRPWYYNEESTLQPGEAREGWVSCLAPDVPLEQLQVKAKYKHIREPEIVTFDLYKPGVFFPDHEMLASVGLTLADLPGSVSKCEEQDYCVSICSRATELKVQQGICAAWTDDNGDISSYSGFRINEFPEPTQHSFLAWTFTSANSFPTRVIRLDDVPLTFYYDTSADDIVRTFGSVTFYNPRIDHSIVTEADAGYDESGQKFKRAGEPWVSVLSQVNIEPYGVAAEDLQGYHNVDIGAWVSVFFERDGTLFSTGAKIYKLDIAQGLKPDSGSIKGVLIGSLGAGNEITTKEGTISQVLPKTALINIYSNYEEAPFSDMRPGIYPVNVVTMYQPYSAFVSKTNMCDVVDCIEYFDEDDTYHHEVKDERVPKPSRSIPIMCAGEWANNVVIDAVNDVYPIEYVGGAWGTDSWYWFGRIDRKWASGGEGDYSYFFYDLRIMGGAAPWWNVIERGRYKDYSGYTVDLRTGLPTNNRVNILGYYSLVNQNDPSRGYFEPLSGFDYSFRGWMGEIIDQKVLAYNYINRNENKDSYYLDIWDLAVDNAGFLFLQEGPIWTASCQRDLLPVLSDKELYAPQDVSLSVSVEEESHDMSSLLPGMSYPASLPLVDGKIYSMGEYGDTYPENNLRFTVSTVETLPGKPDEPVVYVPGEDKFYPADKIVNLNNHVFFQNNNAFAIPPDTTYIRVKIVVDYVGTGFNEGLSCQISDRDDFQLVYPGYLPITGSSESRDQFSKEPPCLGEDHEFWISYMFPSIDFDLEKMLISVHSIEQRPWNFWRLVKE